MGRLAAIELGRRGANLLLVGHNAARGSEAVSAVRSAGGQAEFFQADLGDVAAVLDLAKRVLAHPGRLDVVIHGAGGMPSPSARSREGVDRGFAQNFLGPYLLTRLLEARITASSPARVVAVGSGAYRLLKTVALDAMVRPAAPPTSASEKGRYQMRSYQTSKLAVTAWIYTLAKNWRGRGITANLLDPGMVKSDLGESWEGSAVMGFMMSTFIPTLAADSMERGSQQYVRLASDPDLANVSGTYFVRGQEKPEKATSKALDPAVQKQVIDLAEAWAAPFLARDRTSSEHALACPCELG